MSRETERIEDNEPILGGILDRVWSKKLSTPVDVPVCDLNDSNESSHRSNVIMRFWWPYRTLGFVVGTTDDTKIDSVSKNVFYQSFRSCICKSRKGYVRKLQFSSIFYIKNTLFAYILAFGVRSGVPRMTPLL